MIRVPSLLGLQRIVSRISGGSFYTLAGGATADRTWTFPDRSDTFAGLGAQTFTGPQTINAGTVAQQRSLKLIGGDGAGNPGGLYLTSATESGQDGATVEAVGQRSDANGSSSFCGQLGLAHLRTDTAMVSSGVSLGRVKFGGNPTDTTLGNVVYSAQIRGYASSAWSSSAAMPTGILFSTGSAGIASGSTSEAGTDAVWIDHLGNTGFGVAPTAGNGLLQLASGTTKANGIAFGTDTFVWRNASNSLIAEGSFRSNNATGGIGYATGAGGTVTQITSRTTGVTLNKITGAITLVSAAGSASWQSFTVTNSAVAATDTIICNQVSGTDLNMIQVTAIAAGSFRISFATTGGTTVEQPVLRFTVLKSVSA